MKTISLGSIILVCFLPIHLLSQNNLILNSDFEELLTYQIKNLHINGQLVGKEFKADTFFIISNSKKEHEHVKTEYWNYQSLQKKEFNSFYSKTGNSKKGFAYGYFFPFSQAGNDKFLIKNIAGEFCKPLQKDNTYLLTFWIRHFKGNVHADAIGVKIVEKPEPIVKHFNYNLKQKTEIPTSYIKLPKNQPSEYQKYSVKITAKGGEKYIIIGNPDFIHPRKYTKKELRVIRATRSPFQYTKPSCMYLLDAVSLVNLTNPKDSCFQQLTPLLIQKDSTIKEQVSFNKILKKKEPITSNSLDTIISIEIYFDKNKANFQEEKLIEKLMKIDNQFNINEVKIIGHTDITGQDNYNLLLSQKRALKVLNFLRQNFNYTYTDIEYKGENQPKYIEEYKNRRVEIIIKGTLK